MQYKQLYQVHVTIPNADDASPATFNHWPPGQVTIEMLMTQNTGGPTQPSIQK